ncbi:TIGR01620 family protein [Rhodovulum sp. DZ06]|uniref:TIGR01620 family protein n=1 Tax=Rhodovulum sp. DZ06 TaxID=3425126 RepID=UPI003D326608
MTSGPIRQDAETGAAKPARPAHAARSGPILLEDDLAAMAPETPSSPQDAPPPPDAPEDRADGAAMRRAVAAAAASGAPAPVRSWAGPLLRWALGGALSLAVSVMLWDFVTGMLARAPVLGWIAAALVAGALLGALGLAAAELAGLSRLRRSGESRALAARALAAQDRPGALAALSALRKLWAGRPEMAWPLERLAEREPELLDAEALISEAERTCLAPLDAAARAEAIESARRVAAATAFVPVPAADVAAALWLNLRMIRRIAEIYGGRSGTVGSWRLFRSVAQHLAATGAVAVGDDLIGPALGGGALAKISRRFGEGVVNGALTARVGAAAIEVCRPLPFHAVEKPRARSLVGAALSEWKTKD